MLRRIAVLLGSLAVVVAAAPVAAGGGGCHGPLTDEEGTTVMMSQFCFSPTVVRVAEGETVTWENMDSVDHNVVGSAMPGYGTATLRQGGTASMTFDGAGVYPYVCSLHPGMTGAVVVGDANTPPPPAVNAATAGAPTVDAALGSKSYAALTDRVSELEAAALFAPPPAQESSWPPLAVGVLAGAALAVIGIKLRVIS